MFKIVTILILTFLITASFNVVQASNHPGVALTSGKQGTSGGGQKTLTITTASVTIPANHLALMWVALTHGINTPTITDPSRTWEVVHASDQEGRRVVLYKTLSLVSTTGAATLTSNGVTTWAWSMAEFPATEVLQVGYGDYKIYPQNSAKAILPVVPIEGFTVAAFWVFVSVDNVTPGAGYEFLGGRPCTRGCLQMQSSALPLQEAQQNWTETCFNHPEPCHWMGSMVSVR